MDLAETYSRIAEDWHKDHSHDDWWVPGTNFLLTHVPSNGRILDVGCGSGVKSKYFLERGYDVVGLDISQGLLKIAKRESPRGDFRIGSMTELHLVPEQFDGVFAQASLLHIPKVQAPEVVLKMRDRTTPGGVVYVAVKEVKENQPEEGIAKENDYGYEYERFFSYFTMSELKDYFKRAGLTPVWQDAHKFGKTTWLQIIGRR